MSHGQLNELPLLNAAGTTVRRPDAGHVVPTLGHTPHSLSSSNAIWLGPPRAQLVGGTRPSQSVSVGSPLHSRPTPLQPQLTTTAAPGVHDTVSARRADRQPEVAIAARTDTHTTAQTGPFARVIAPSPRRAWYAGRAAEFTHRLTPTPRRTGLAHTRAMHGPARTASLLAIAVVAASCGGARASSETASATPIETVTDTPETEPRDEAIASVPIAPGAQLAAGRLGSTLEGLEPGTWSLPGRFDEVAGGPDAVSDHTLARSTEAGGTYTLHVLAWDSFVPSPSPLDAAPAAARARLRGAIPIDAGDPELAIVGVLDPHAVRDRDPGPERSIEWGSLGGVVAQLVVAVRGGSIAHLSLVCDASEACRSADHTELVRELARSLRRGPPLAGGEPWALRLPHDARTDRVVTIALPPGLIALPARSREGALIAPVVDLASGALALELVMRVSSDASEAIVLEPGTRGDRAGEVPAEARLSCGPFACVARFRDEHGRAALVRAFEDASVVEVPAEEQRVSLGGGRLSLAALGRSIDDVWHDRLHDYEDGGPEDHHDHHVRIGAGLAHLDVSDTLRPASELETRAGTSAEALETSDPSLRVVRVARDAPAERMSDWPVAVERLVVAEQGGTLLEVDVLCMRDEPCVADDPSGLAELARRLARGAPSC